MKRQTVLVLAASLMAIALISCGEPDEIDPGAGGDDPDTPVTSGPVDNSPVPDGSPSYTEPQPGQDDLRAIAWDNYRVKDDGNTLYVKYWSGVEPCNVLDHVDVEYTSDEVIVTVWEGSSPTDKNTACIEIAVLKTTIVELDEPLGDRKVVDGSKGA